MKIDNNIVAAVRKIGHDRLVVHPTGIYSCKVTPDVKFGDKGTALKDASIIYGAKNIVLLGDIYLTAPFGVVDLKNESTT